MATILHPLLQLYHHHESSKVDPIPPYHRLRASSLSPRCARHRQSEHAKP